MRYPHKAVIVEVTLRTRTQAVVCPVGAQIGQELGDILLEYLQEQRARVEEDLRQARDPFASQPSDDATLAWYRDSAPFLNLLLNPARA